jgi:uncharacterized protein (TIGR01319 family)
MVTVGLVRELTAEAARQAALGAGAKLVGCFAYRLTAADVRQIQALAPDVLLLCGGTDGGNRDVILFNAQRLAGAQLQCPVIVAGNREASEDIVELLPEAIVADNVMPELNVLRIDPARHAIRDVFMRRIVQAKGIDRVRGMLDDVLMPTPAAVLEGARLLASGPPGQTGMGPLVVLDPGGATTDVHSICDGAPAQPGAVPVGLPEPHDKRTVEAISECVTTPPPSARPRGLPPSPLTPACPKPPCSRWCRGSRPTSSGCLPAPTKKRSTARSGGPPSASPCADMPGGARRCSPPMARCRCSTART